MTPRWTFERDIGELVLADVAASWKPSGVGTN
jgi:hypothetical protein